MSNKILEDVKSPFTDELIKELIEKYIDSGCNDKLFYRQINNLATDIDAIDQTTMDFIQKVKEQGDEKSELWNIKEEERKDLIYSENKDWVMLYSDEDPMNQNVRKKDYEPLYRIYLDLKGKEKVGFIRKHINSCIRSQIPYEFKFSKIETRKDQIVLLTKLEDLERNVELIENLTEGMNKEEIPMLVGKYKDNIGIAEEYYNRLYSPTTAKLSLVRTSVKKYLCDHIDEYSKELPSEDNEKINEYISEFNEIYSYEDGFKEKFKEKYDDLHKNSYQMMDTMECAKLHIENDSDSYVCGNGLLDLNETVKKIYSLNSDQFINEVTENYKIIGTQVWGFSDDFIFSRDTKRVLDENRKVFSAESIGEQLGDIARSGLANVVKEVIVNIAEKNQREKQEGENGKSRI